MVKSRSHGIESATEDRSVLDDTSNADPLCPAVIDVYRTLLPGQLASRPSHPRC